MRKRYTLGEIIQAQLHKADKNKHVAKHRKLMLGSSVTSTKSSLAHTEMVGCQKKFTSQKYQVTCTICDWYPPHFC